MSVSQSVNVISWRQWMAFLSFSAFGAALSGGALASQSVVL